jgi:hypothetical protein
MYLENATGLTFSFLEEEGGPFTFFLFFIME